MLSESFRSQIMEDLKNLYYEFYVADSTKQKHYFNGMYSGYALLAEQLGVSKKELVSIELEVKLNVGNAFKLINRNGVFVWQSTKRK